MTIARPITKTVISTTEWGIPITDAVNGMQDAINAGGWTSFVPQWTNLTVGSGLNVGYYSYNAARTMMDIFMQFTFGAGSVINTNPQMALPDGRTVLPALPDYLQLGNLRISDDNGNKVLGSVRKDGTGISFAYLSPSGTVVLAPQVSATAPHTWAVNDFMAGWASVPLA